MRSAASLALYILTIAGAAASPAAQPRLAAVTPPPSINTRPGTADHSRPPVARGQPVPIPIPCPTPSPTPSRTNRGRAYLKGGNDLRQRQDKPAPDSDSGTTSTTSVLTLFDAGPTATDSSTDGGTGTEDDGEKSTAPPATPTESVSHDWLTTSRLTPESSAVPLAATMGLIMPNPWQNIYVEQEYRLGFIDAVAKPAPTVGGWMRQVQPLLIVPGNKVNTFDLTGPKDPSDPLAVPPQSDGLARVEDDAVRYPFIFHTPGWYMLVINQTWYKPTITDHICALPYITQNTFFATHLLSVRPLPTSGPMPPNPAPPHTVFAEVSLETPGRLPIDPGVMGRAATLGVGLGVTFGVLALIAAVGMLWWFHRRNKRQREEVIFRRMKPHEQAAFIAENPTHFLNPHRAEYQRAQRGMYRGTDMFGQPRPWWSRWGQGSGIGAVAGPGMVTGGAMPGSYNGMSQGYGYAPGRAQAHGHGYGGMSYASQGQTEMAGGQMPYEYSGGVGAQDGRGEVSGWKKFFARGSGLSSQQAYLQQQAQAQQQLLRQHQHEQQQSHGHIQQFHPHQQPPAGAAHDPYHEQSKEAGYGYAEAGQGQDARQVYQVPFNPQGPGGAGGDMQYGQGGQGVMVYPTAQRWR